MNLWWIWIPEKMRNQKIASTIIRYLQNRANECNKRFSIGPIMNQNGAINKIVRSLGGYKWGGVSTWERTITTRHE